MLSSMVDPKHSYRSHHSAIEEKQALAQAEPSEGNASEPSGQHAAPRIS